jgi:hypothetical protein
MPLWSSLSTVQRSGLASVRCHLHAARCQAARPGPHVQPLADLLTAVGAGCLQVDYIMTHAEPYTQSVKKSARRLSMAATDFAHRTLGTKTHFR